MVRMKVINFEDKLNDNIKLINDMSYFDKELLENPHDLLTTVYDSTEIDPRLQCKCGYTVGNYKKGNICEKCGNPVGDPFADLDPEYWFKTTSNEYKFITPYIWGNVNALVGKKVNFLRWLGDTSYNPNRAEIPLLFTKMASEIGGRGYKNLYDNIELVIRTICSTPSCRGSINKREKADAMLEILDLYGIKAFTSDILPLPNKALFVMEKTSKGKYVNMVHVDLQNVVMEFILNSKDDVSAIKRSNLMASTIANLDEVLKQKYTKFVGSKPGLARKNIAASRIPFSMRTLMISNNDIHNYNDLIVPWKVGLTMMRPHVLNKLCYKYNMPYSEAKALIDNSIYKYDKLLSDILDELVAESMHGRGIPFLWHRNPTLLPGSIQLVYIVAFGKDPMHKATKMSHLIMFPMNADVDGDELNGALLIDEVMYEQFKVFDNHYNAPDLQTPYGISGNLSLGKPAVATVSNYLKTDFDEEE